jgi:hypothetical protein
MKLPDLVTNLIQPKPETRELFLSLIIDTDAIAAAAWYMDPTGEPHLLSHASAPVAKDAWDHFTEVTDSLLTVVEDKAGSKTAIGKVVLGLPQAYLTDEGTIKPSIRPHIKALTRELDLKPVGFVPVQDAIAFMIKREDGVPASVILINVQKTGMTVFLYRIGKLIGYRHIPGSGDATPQVEAVLKEFQDHDVLPSRMLLFGADTPYVEEVRAQLLKYPWTTRANFLHFPKIETLGIDEPIGAVCFAGAKELGAATHAPGLGEEPEPEEEEAPPKPEEDEKAVEELPTEQNVVEVAPEDLGFKKGEDVLTPSLAASERIAPEQDPGEEIPMKTKGRGLPQIGPALAIVREKLAGFHIPKLPQLPGGKVAPLIVGGVILLLLLILWYWNVPKASVTILVAPKTIEKETTVIVDPDATAADSQSGTLPGATQEKSVSGEKTIPVTGKKSVGDPAKGNVSVFNKSTTASRTFAKGAVLTNGPLEFTLDADVTVASASENLSGGTITYGKGTGAITASQIGPNSNLPAGTEFTFEDISSGIAIARNEEALSGGTSRDVTVVTRADYDKVVASLTDELVTKAKEELAADVAGGRKLIDATIKTAVTEKTFAQELDQEASQVSGKVTLTVTGMSYSESDISAIIAALSTPDVPSGYTLAPSRTSLVVKSTKVAKDGSVTMPISFTALALPQIDENAVRSAIAGKNLDRAQEALKQFEGVVGIEVAIRLTPWKNRLPVNRKNISVSVSIQE